MSGFFEIGCRDWICTRSHSGARLALRVNALHLCFPKVCFATFVMNQWFNSNPAQTKKPLDEWFIEIGCRDWICTRSHSGARLALRVNALHLCFPKVCFATFVMNQWFNSNPAQTKKPLDEWFL